MFTYSANSYSLIDTIIKDIKENYKMYYIQQFIWESNLSKRQENVAENLISGSSFEKGLKTHALKIILRKLLGGVCQKTV